MNESQYDIPDAVFEAAASGQKIKAIKILRLETGLGLKEAKEIIDALDLPAKKAGDANLPAMQEEGGASGFYQLIAIIVALLILYSVFFAQ